MKMYNTLSRTVEELQPMNPTQFGFYACGPTVYDYAHIGNIRKYVMDDVLIRTLRHAGLPVKFVQNITDVGHLTSDSDTGEDKLEKGARKYGKTAWDVAKKFEEYFWYAMDTMGNQRPDVSCCATDHIPEQLAMVQELEKKGYTYVIEGDGVYMDTSKIPDYGKLALIDINELREGARVEKIPGKKNPTDFALWKFERPGENRTMVWESPWHPRSFPGWHIECSAMSVRYLGEQFDMHTGGVDHINIHHTNEIAQSEMATSKVPFVKYWVHHNFLRVEGEKMSKSLGNVFRVDDIIERGYNPMALRLLFLTSHYRSEMNFTWANLDGMQKTYDKLIAQVISLKQESGRTMLSEDKLAKLDKFRNRFFGALEDDLKTPEAVAVMWEMLKSNIPGPDKYDLLMEFDEVLNLGLRKAELQKPKLEQPVATQDLPATVQEVLAQREAARQAQNWDEADRLRDELQTKGWVVKDTAQGQQVTKA